jgi:3-hydroxybutyrate dehydrogenase
MHGLLDKTAALAQVSALEKEYGVRVGFSDADVTDPAAVAAMVHAARADFGSLDILCNNAGIQHVSPVVDFPHDKVGGQKGGGGNKGGS